MNKEKIAITQAMYDTHDCRTPSGDGCESCILWQEQLRDLELQEKKQYENN